jgi:hypothetical protein
MPEQQVREMVLFRFEQAGLSVGVHVGQHGFSLFEAQLDRENVTQPLPGGRDMLFGYRRTAGRQRQEFPKVLFGLADPIQPQQHLTGLQSRRRTVLAVVAGDCVETCSRGCQPAVADRQFTRQRQDVESVWSALVEVAKLSCRAVVFVLRHARRHCRAVREEPRGRGHAGQRGNRAGKLHSTAAGRQRIGFWHGGEKWDLSGVYLAALDQTFCRDCYVARRSLVLSRPLRKEGESVFNGLESWRAACGR